MDRGPPRCPRKEHRSRPRSETILSENRTPLYSVGYGTLHMSGNPPEIGWFALEAQVRPARRRSRPAARVRRAGRSRRAPRGPSARCRTCPGRRGSAWRLPCSDDGDSSVAEAHVFSFAPSEPIPATRTMRRVLPITSVERSSAVLAINSRRGSHVRFPQSPRWQLSTIEGSLNPP